MKFQDAIQNIVTQSVRDTAHTLQGYIPQGGIQVTEGTCTVRVPNPKGATHPAQGASQNYVEYRGVALPFTGAGLFAALGSLVLNRDRAVLIGFKGGNQAHPFIHSFLSFFYNHTDRQEQNTKARSPVIGQRFASTAPLVGATVGPTAARINASALPPAGSITPLRLPRTPLNRPVAARTAIEQFIRGRTAQSKQELDGVLTNPLSVRVVPKQ